ncbi:hypothetical protein LK09_02640 [Microbacterium mangrovi]|uniref:histidine kinase n=1 Tax=Microbacterium mangrovi TaxID=1348253 RepID=A0A0B2A8W3_9MICO|nr:sensor histidine kinase [Microbacterium mangrovi]KHK99540.1 hypothetical protein LK09_02640 [Microbacterium mangrovi]
MIVRPSPLAVVLSTAGAVLLGWWLLQDQTRTPVATALAVTALIAWIARTVFALLAVRHPAFRRAAVLAAVVGVAAGSLSAPGTDGLGIVPAAVCIVIVLADPDVPLWAGLSVAVGGLGLLALAAVGSGTTILSLLAMCGGMLLAMLGGYSRRQGLLAQRQAALLAERDLQMREEASRIALARDLHDVLAHTLGGLVIQLDAAEALMDAGDAAASRSRVADARALAGAGLAEARRAVAALRAPQADDAPDLSPAALRTMLTDLLEAHRALGGRAELTESGDPRTVPAVVGTTLQRALQEALSNARRHAPGEAVSVGVGWHDDRVALTVANPVAGSQPSPGGGYGLIGMRERFAALPHGGAVRVQRDADRFVLEAEARLR